jgi:hypothetical protein
MGSGGYRSREAPPSRGSSGAWVPTVSKETPRSAPSTRPESFRTKRKRSYDDDYDDDEDFDEDEETPRAPAKKAHVPKSGSSHKAPKAPPQNLMPAEDVASLQVGTCFISFSALLVDVNVPCFWL